MFSPTNSLASLSLNSPINGDLRPLVSSSSVLKRKRSPLSHPDDDSPASSTSRSPSAPSPSASTPSEPSPTKQEMSGLPVEPVADSGLIRCICGFTDDDGLTIFCDMCGFWQHISCVLYQPRSQSDSVFPKEDPLPMDTEDDVSPPVATEQWPRAHSPPHSLLHPNHPSQPPSSSRGVSASISKPKTLSKFKPTSPPSPGRPKLGLHSPPSAKPAIPETLPEQWFCERCIPRPVDAAGARERQMVRMLADRAASVSAASASAGAVTDEAEMDDMVDIDEAGPSTPLPLINGKRRTGGAGEKRRKSNAADNAPTTSSWGAPPPPRRASTKAGTPSSQTSGRNKRPQPGSTPSGLSKRDEDTLFEPWATEYTHISTDVVPDRRVREQIALWAQTLLDEEEDWCYTTPLLSSGGKMPISISPLTSCIPVHPFSAVFAASIPGVSSSSGNPNSKKVKVQVRPIPNADCTPLPSPSVCPASPVVTPTSYPFPPLNGSPLPSPAGSFDSSPRNLPGGALGYVGSSAGYTRPPTYGLYTSCPTAHSQQQSLTSSPSSSSNPNTGGSGAGLPYFTSTIPAGTLLAPFTSCICSLESYVAAPSSQYALLQTAKPFVHLIGRVSRNESCENEDKPPALALDAREMGGEARWARSGCFPNAAIRPVLEFVSPTSPTAPESPALSSKKGVKSKPKKGGQAELTLSWGLYSTRPIAPRGEEVILGWEWDRCSAVHRLKKIVKDGCSDAQDESDVKTQLSQILYTLGGTFTSCACGRQNNSSLAAGEPIRECVFSMMARFVCERSRFVGKPSAGLTLSVPVPPPSRSLNGSSRRGPKTPAMIPKLSLDAASDHYRANIDLGPMVGWPDEEDELSGNMTFPLGAGPGVCALPLPGPLSYKGARQHIIYPGTSHSPVVTCRASTPPPPGLDVSQNHSRSAPPHFADTGLFVQRTAVSVGSPLIKGHELGLQSGRRGWADVVGLDEPLDTSLHPSPSLHNVPPSVKSGRDRTSTVTHTGKVLLPKLQTDGVLEPDLEMQMMCQTPSPVRDSAAFAASLSSSLGLDMETDDTPTEMDLDTSFETASIATADSGFGLAEEPRGEDSASITNTDGQPVKLPPWARKRVRSTSSIPALSHVHAIPSPVPTICGMSFSLPPQNRIHNVMSFPVTEAVIGITEDTEMINGTVTEMLTLKPSDTKTLPAELIVDPSVMPPPPIPAALDPTTVTSISVSSTPVIEQPQPSSLTPASTAARSPGPTVDRPDADLALPAVPEATATAPASETGGNESELQEETATPQPPPVRMSFLDWKRKREATQKERVLEEAPIAEKAKDETGTPPKESQKRPSERGETQPPSTEPNEFATAGRSDAAVIKFDDTPNAMPPAATEDIVMEESHGESGDEHLSKGTCLLPVLENFTDPSSIPSSASVFSDTSSAVRPTGVFSPSSRPVPTSAPVDPRPVAEADDDTKASIMSDSEVSTKVSTPSSTPPPLLNPVSEEDAEDGEIVDSPVELTAPATGVVDHPPTLSVKGDSKSPASTPTSSSPRPSPPPRRPSSPGRHKIPPTRDQERYGPIPNGKIGRRPTFSPPGSFAPASPADSHTSSVSERDREEHRYRYRRPSSPVANNPSVYKDGASGYGSYSRRGSSMSFSSSNSRWYPPRRTSPPPMSPRDRDYEYGSNGWNNRGRYQRPYRGRGGFHSGYRPNPNVFRRGGPDREDDMKQPSSDSRPRPSHPVRYYPTSASTIPPAD